MIPRRRVPLALLGCLVLAALRLEGQVAGPPERVPGPKATKVNPDTHLVLTFSSRPVIGSSGTIRIREGVRGPVVDTLDLAIAAGPRGPAAAGAPVPEYQRTVVGGFTEGFHFYPVIVRGNVATIYPHNNVLKYGKTYSVEIDRGAITAPGFEGIATGGWTFSTKPDPPKAAVDRLVVSADGTGDFNTVQGAVDSLPDKAARRTTIFIRRGIYEEIVYFRNKSNITFLGEDRDASVVGYANNESFNGPPPGVATNEKPGTFPYRRAAFMADRSTGIHIVNLTLRNFTPAGGGQAEALLMMGGENIVSHVSLYSHQDTVQFNDSVYVERSYIEGDTDFLWGRGPAFFRDCDLRQNSASPFMWVRSTSASHGFVFVNCRFDSRAEADPGPFLARNTAGYPNSEVVLIDSAIGSVNPAAWSLAGDTTNQHYWEFNSRRIGDGAPADVSRRHPASKQLSAERDAETIANYRNPSYVLGGWTPTMAPIVIKPPAAVAAVQGQPVIFTADVAAIPAVTYRWLRNGTVLKDGDGLSGTTTSTLKIDRTRGSDAGTYAVKVDNSVGSVISPGAALKLVNR